MLIFYDSISKFFHIKPNQIASAVYPQGATGETKSTNALIMKLSILSSNSLLCLYLCDAMQ